jgi:hypothetical protein
MLLASSIPYSQRAVGAMFCTAFVSLSLSSMAFAQQDVTATTTASTDPAPTPMYSFTAQPSEQTNRTVSSERPWSFWRTTKQIALDPTTYAPALISYEATKLDWDTSQVFFRNGYVEGNERFTLDGTPNSTPLPYGRGDRKIMVDTLQILGGSMAHNFIERSMEQVLLEKYPDHPKLVKTLGWIERSVFASYWSYRLSSAHFRQWNWNKQQAAALGLQ